MALRLYCDQDSLNHAVVQSLRLTGIDVLTAPEAGLESAPDEVQLQFAAAEQRLLYTANTRDFAPLHARWLAEGRSHRGIVVRHRQQLSIGAQVRGLRAICSSLSPDAAINRLEYLEAWLTPR